jgi:hypothetical protein
MPSPKTWPGSGPFVAQRFVGPQNVQDSHTWRISGLVQTSSSVPVSGATIKVFRSDTNALVATTVSNASGQWSVQVPINYVNYWATGFLAGSPDIYGTTDINITPS